MIESNHWFISSHEVVQAIAIKLIVAIGSRVSRKTVNSVGQGPAYQNSGVGLMLLGNNDC